MINLKPYEQPMPVGVRLPQTKIDDKYYKKLGLETDISNYQFLRALCLNGVKERGIDKLPNKQEYYDRTKMELSILDELSFTDYVILNWDILNFCHENNIPTGFGRGSAAGSLVLYLIGVTNVDPIKYNLFFERFVSKSRAKKTTVDGIDYLDGSLIADVDNDISYDQRSKVIKYIEEKHKGKTCKILTLNTLSSKLCLKECSKIVDEYSEDQANELSATIPKKFGKVLKIDDAYEESEQFKNYIDAHPQVHGIAKKLQGLNKNTGVHPSGIAISYYDIEEIMPMQKTNDGDFVSAYDMDNVASLMIKFDILGLRTLSVVHQTCKEIGISIEDIDISKPEIYENFKNIEAPKGLFQIEADTNFKVCKKVKPRNIEDLSAVIAIARPGALDYLDTYANYVRTGDFQSVNSFFDDILSYTGGIPLYQEQLMKMAVKIGFTLDESEQLRRIIGKKKVDQMPAWKQKIEKKIEENDLDSSIGEVLWKVAEDSANYSFNKSHSLSYSFLSAITTYLKFKYPKEFFLSLLKMSMNEPDSHEEISLINQELNLFNIKLLSPDLSKSKLDFSIEGNNIRYGLGNIKGVSDATLEKLVEFRGHNKEFENKYDLFLSAKECGLNIGVLSGLIQGGLVDSFCSYVDGIPNRSRLVLEAQAFNILTSREKRNIQHLGNRFDYDVLNTIYSAVKDKLVADDNKPIFKESRFESFKKKYNKYKEIYAKNKNYLKFANWYFEKKYLGYSYSFSLKEIFKQSDEYVDTLELKSIENNDKIKLVGFVVDSVSSKSRNGNKYMKVTLQDDVGQCNFLLVNSQRNDRLDEYLNNGGKKPEKEQIVFVYGSKGEDIIFAEAVSILDEKIYTKLSDIK